MVLLHRGGLRLFRSGHLSLNAQALIFRSTVELSPELTRTLVRRVYSNPKNYKAMKPYCQNLVRWGVDYSNLRMY